MPAVTSPPPTTSPPSAQTMMRDEETCDPEERICKVRLGRLPLPWSIGVHAAIAVGVGARTTHCTQRFETAAA